MPLGTWHVVRGTLYLALDLSDQLDLLALSDLPHLSDYQTMDDQIIIA